MGVAIAIELKLGGNRRLRISSQFDGRVSPLCWNCWSIERLWRLSLSIGERCKVPFTLVEEASYCVGIG